MPEHVPQSMLGWMVDSLGFLYLVLIPGAGLLAFVLALAIVFRGHGPLAAAALVLVVHVPLLIGVFAALHGGISVFSIIAASTATPKPAELSAGISTCLVAPFVSLFVMAPSYAVAVLGALIRCLTASGNGREGKS